MTPLLQLHAQRSAGSIDLCISATGIDVLREEGSAKCRMPRGSNEAILINTSGGLAGGDTVAITATAKAGASLTLTSQAAERVYRTLGPPADVRVKLAVHAGASLLWMPQDTILFEGSALKRVLDVDLADDATILLVEPIVFGRREMGEIPTRLLVQDIWNVRKGGHLIHAEQFRLGPERPKSKATLANNHAMATVVLVSPLAETLIDNVRRVLGPDDGASAWNGKLVARLVASDGFHLRKTLIQVLIACVGRDRLPKTWTF